MNLNLLLLLTAFDDISQLGENEGLAKSYFVK